MLSHFEFTNRLRNNDPFIHTVYRHTALLHSSGKPILPPQMTNPNNNIVTPWWVKGINLARQQYRKALRAAERNDRRPVLFCLHRAAVETCTALIALHTACQQTGQRISKLLCYCDNFCLIRILVFPFNTPEE